jgi:hypothetical protein
MAMRTTLLGFLCWGLAFLIALHHLLVAGRWFDFRDIYNHEFIIAFVGGAGCGLFLESLLTQR